MAEPPHQQQQQPRDNGENKKEDDDYLTVLNQMRESALTRQFTRAQSEVVELAFLKYNLLLRGPANCGKRFIARAAGDLLGIRRRYGQKVETVEVMAKWFTVTPSGQTMIDEASLSIAKEQIQRATVLIIENVPCHPQAAAAFFAHLDFYCKAERCKSHSKLQLKSPAQASFGGIQIIATQNDITDSIEPHPLAPINQVLWARSSTSLIAAPTSTSSSATTSSTASASGGAGPTQTMPHQIGILVTTAAPPTSNPHPDVFVLLFR